MPARLRLPLALLVCALATAALSLTLWSAEKNDVRDEARERSRGTAAALEQRAGAAVLALQGVRAAYDASSSVGPEAFSTFARVPLARPEIAAVGWVPLVAAAQRGEVEATERIRIEAPAGLPFTYPLVRQEPAATSLDVQRPRLRSFARRGAQQRPHHRAAAPLRSGAPSRRRPDRRLRLRARLRQGPAAPHVRAAPESPQRARRRRDRLERARSRRPEGVARRAGRAHHRRPDRARPGRRRHRDRPRRARWTDLARLLRSHVPLPGRTDRHGLRGHRTDAVAGGRLAAASPARGLRSCARDNSRARAEDLGSRARPRRVHDRRGAADAPARRGRKRRARPRDRPRRPDQVVLGRSRAAARLHGRGARRHRGLLAPAPGRPALARKRPAAVRAQGRNLHRARRPPALPARRARLRRRRRHRPSRPGRSDPPDRRAADPGCGRARARSRRAVLRRRRRDRARPRHRRRRRRPLRDRWLRHDRRRLRAARLDPARARHDSPAGGRRARSEGLPDRQGHGRNRPHPRRCPPLGSARRRRRRRRPAAPACTRVTARNRVRRRERPAGSARNA